MEGLTSLSLLDWLPVASNLEKKSSVVIIKKKKGIVLYSSVRQPRAPHPCRLGVGRNVTWMDVASL